MSEIISSTYKIIGELGAGGGGVVYLAEHLRLGKKVVLKADKRSVKTRTELLRREVDILKELSHQYIPQVYDYFIEDDISYTVMDYVDGESLNKVLEREKKIPQPTAIKWARQLLEALIYLHSPIHGDPPRGYIHSDIKPGNIMLRPNGDICLIDFNISLAIGIESVVGRSPGYSSPEHYGLDYSFVPTEKKNTQSAVSDETEVESQTTEIADSSIKAKSELSSSLKRVTVLDARSDIYSISATLYHLITGKRPNDDAKKVEPLSDNDVSPLFAEIITKGMNPNPDLRFSSAEEMLQAINGLWKNDPRVKSHRRGLIAGVSVLAAMLALGGCGTYIGLKQMERLQTAQVIAAESAQALYHGDVKGAINTAITALSGKGGLFDIPYTTQAQLALTDALGVYDLSDSFKSYYRIELPSAPFRMTKSADETMLIAGYAYELAIYNITDGSLIKTLPTLESALCEIEPLGDKQIVYGGRDGITAYDIASDTVLWQGEPATAIAVSGDKSTVAAINGSDDVVKFYDAASGKLISERSLNGNHLNVPENDRFADSQRDVFELDDKGRLCAISLNNGYLGFMDIDDPENDLILYEESDYTNFDGGYSGDLFAFSAAGRSGSLFGLIDITNAEYIGDMTGNSIFDVQIRNDKIYLSEDDVLVEFDPKTFEEIPAAYTEDKNIIGYDISDKYVLAATDDTYSIFFEDAGLMQTVECDEPPVFTLITDSYAAAANRDSPYIEVQRLKNCGEQTLLSYDPRIDHSEARLNADHSGVMLFDVYGFSILNSDGSVKAEKELPDPEKIYDQQYRRDKGYLEVTYYSGKVVCYSDADGSIVSEYEIAPPDESLDEKFETEKYIINAPLHGTPTVYDKLSGEQIAALESEDYLTYISEYEDYIIAQYVCADGSFYGVLMNGQCETLAHLPCLCDVSDGMLVFDFPSGNIRTSPIFELDELKEKAEHYWD